MLRLRLPPGLYKPLPFRCWSNRRNYISKIRR